MRPDGGAVDHLDVAVVRGGDGVHEVAPDACLSPSHEAVVAGGARAVALGQIAPGRTGSQHPEDAIQHAAIVHARHASRLVGQQRLDHAPLEVGQVVSAHANPESGGSRLVKPRAFHDYETQRPAVLTTTHLPVGSRLRYSRKPPPPVGPATPLAISSASSPLDETAGNETLWISAL